MKKGDIIVCLNKITGEPLTVGKQYTITFIGVKDYNVTIINDNGVETFYAQSRFISLQGYRQLQINKILRDMIISRDI